MVFWCLRKLDSKCMEVGRSCAEKNASNIYWKTHSTNISLYLRHGSWNGVETTALRSCWFYFFFLVFHWDSVGCSKLTQAVVDWSLFFVTTWREPRRRRTEKKVVDWSFVELGGPVCRDFPRDLRLGYNLHAASRFVENFWKSWSTRDCHRQTYPSIFWNAVLSRNASNFGGDSVIFDNLAMPHLWHFPWDFQTLWRLELGLPLLERLRAAQLPVACSRTLHKLAFCDVSWTKTGYKYILKFIVLERPFWQVGAWEDGFCCFLMTNEDHAWIWDLLLGSCCFLSRLPWSCLRSVCRGEVCIKDIYIYDIIIPLDHCLL